MLVKTILLFWLCLVASVNVASADAIAPLSSWESALYTDHPLVGKVWNARTGEFADLEEVTSLLESARYLLLGEKHDNPDHHYLQQIIISHLINNDLLSTISMEMIDSGADQQLAKMGEQKFDSLDALRNYLQWDVKGWNWDFYGPLLFDLVQAGIPLYSANLSRAQIGEVYGQPLDPKIASVLDSSAAEQLNKEIDESHCGLLPESQFPSMLSVQKSRDHQMAKSLVDAGADESNGIKVLIAGDYHIRHDLGVPNYVLALDPSVNRDDVISLAVIEVGPGSQEPRDYMNEYVDNPSYDLIWFTPAISDEDYCDSLKK